MRPQNPLDWIAFVFLLIGAFAWGYFFLTGINFIETLLNPSHTCSPPSSTSSSSFPASTGYYE